MLSEEVIRDNLRVFFFPWSDEAPVVDPRQRELKCVIISGSEALREFEGRSALKFEECTTEGFERSPSVQRSPSSSVQRRPSSYRRGR